jgi:exosortase
MFGMSKRFSLFLLSIAVSLLVAWRPLLETISLAWQNDMYTHILLILPVSLFMIFAERQMLWTASSWSFRGGAAVIFGAVIISCCAWTCSASLTADMLLMFGMVALVLWWIGCFLLCFGARSTRKLLFPLLFLFGLVPLPRIVLDWSISQLQIGSSWSTHALLALFGVPVLQQGVLITVPGLVIQVAQECSSIRSSSMLIVTTLVMAQVLLVSFWRKALVVSLAVPLSVLKNGLRIFVLVMLGTRVDPAYLHGQLHHQGGIIFFGIAVGGILALIWLLRKREHAVPISRPRPLDALTPGD